MRNCIPKNIQRCHYLTKDNYEEFLKEAYPNYDQDYIKVEITEKAVEVQSYDMVHVSREFQYGWWVEESDTYGYPMWFSYSDDEFQKKFMLFDKIYKFPVDVDKEVQNYKKTLEFIGKITL